MDLWRYQVEIVAAVALVASAIVVAVIMDYVFNYNEIGREHAQEENKAP